MLTRVILLFLFSFSLLSADKYSLAALCEKGIKNNPKIKSLAYRSSASHSVYDQSIDRYKPHLNISGQYGNQNYDLGSSDNMQRYHGVAYNYNFSLKQPIYRAQLLHSIKDAEAREVMSKLGEKDEKAKLVTQILQVSIELTRQRKIIDILTKKVSLLGKAHENIQKKYNLQLASGADTFQSQAMLQESKSDLIKAKQFYDYNLYNLRLLTKYKDVEKYISSLQFDIPAVNKAFKKAKLKAIKNSIENNTRIKLDRQLVNIARVQIGMRNSERSPQFDAVLSYGDAGGSLDAVTRQNDSRAMITLNFPIFQGGYVDDRVEEAKYLLMASQEDAENSRMNIRISMEKALQNIKGGLESVKAQKSAVEASRKYFAAAMESYKSGVASLTDAYLAESDYRDNQLRLANSESDIFISLAEIYYYSGIADYKHVTKLQKKYFK